MIEPQPESSENEQDVRRLRKMAWTTVGTSAAMILAAIVALGRQIAVVAPSHVLSEVRTVSSDSLSLSEGERVVGTAQLSSNGTRILLALVSPDGHYRLLLWEYGFGRSELFKGAVITSYAISADGLRAYFIGAHSSSDTLSFFLWEEGFGLRELVSGALSGSWTVSASPDGMRALLLPSDLRASSSTVGWRAGQALSLQLGQSTSAGSATLSEIQPVSVPESSILGPSGAVSSVTRSDGKLQAQLGAITRRRPVDDFDGDGGSDLLLFQRGGRAPVWRMYTLSGVEGVTPRVTGERATALTWRYGDSNGIAVPGDYNGDSLPDLATFTPFWSGDWNAHAPNWRIYLTPPPGPLHTWRTPPAPLERSWGADRALPVPADYDGDGGTDLAVYLPHLREWRIAFSRTGFNTALAHLGRRDYGAHVRWGVKGGVPVPADYNGDGQADLALFAAEADGRIVWRIRTALRRPKAVKIPFGEGEDIPVPGHYDCAPEANLAIYRPRTGSWIIRHRSGAFREIGWSVDNAEPLNGDFDGDGCDDLAFYSPAGNPHWTIRNSSLVNLHVIEDNRHAISRLYWGDPQALPPQVLLRKLYLEQR